MDFTTRIIIIIIINKETNMSILKRPPEKAQELPKDDSEQKES